MEGIRVRAVEEDKLNRPHTFEIYSKTSEVIKACKTDPAGKLVEGQHSVYRMAASNHEDMLNWISAIQYVFKLRFSYQWVASFNFKLNFKTWVSGRIKESKTKLNFTEGPLVTFFKLL